MPCFALLSLARVLAVAPLAATATLTHLDTSSLSVPQNLQAPRATVWQIEPRTRSSWGSDVTGKGTAEAHLFAMGGAGVQQTNEPTG